MIRIGDGRIVSVKPKLAVMPLVPVTVAELVEFAVEGTEDCIGLVAAPSA